jgi:8-oxo-dGTP pyrophosphatase MutT (NUDIX family)
VGISGRSKRKSPWTLAREFGELGIGVEIQSPYGAVEYSGKDGRALRVRFFLARRLQGSPRALEVEAVAWVPAKDLPRVDFIPANREIVNRLAEEVEERGAG